MRRPTLAVTAALAALAVAYAAVPEVSAQANRGIDFLRFSDVKGLRMYLTFFLRRGGPVEAGLVAAALQAAQVVLAPLSGAACRRPLQAVLGWREQSRVAKWGRPAAVFAGAAGASRLVGFWPVDLVGYLTGLAALPFGLFLGATALGELLALLVRRS